MRVEGIEANQNCERLHFLHAAVSTSATNGTILATYEVCFADGQKQDVPITMGVDIADWWKQRGEHGMEDRVAWEGTNRPSAARGYSIRLFKTTWENPRPTAAIKTINFAANSNARPVLVAITAE